MMKLQHEEIAMLENNKVTILLDGQMMMLQYSEVLQLQDNWVIVRDDDEFKNKLIGVMVYF